MNPNPASHNTPGDTVNGHLVRCKSSVCGSAYVVSRAAAIHMLETIPFYQPIDWTMNRAKANHTPHLCTCIPSFSDRRPPPVAVGCPPLNSVAMFSMC